MTADNEPRVYAEMISTTIPTSAEMLAAHPPIDWHSVFHPTPEQARERAAYRAQLEAGWAAQRDAWATQVAGMRPGPLRSIAELHTPGLSGDCDGCYDEMGATWPCQTAEIILKADPEEHTP